MRPTGLNPPQRGEEASLSLKPLLVTKETSSQFNPELILPVSERVEIGDFLINSGLSSMGGRFITCRTPKSNLVFICKNCNDVQIRPASCNVRFCPRCNSRRYMQLKQKFGSGLSGMHAPSFLSLSYPNVKKLEKEAMDYASTAFARLRRSKCFRGVYGGFYGLDATFNPVSKTFNVHIHSIIDSPFLNRNAVYARWLEITSDMGGKTRNVHIERAFTFINGRKVKWHPRRKKSVKAKILKSCSGYLLSHSVKAPALPTAHMLASFLVACYNKRLLQGFGSMFGLPSGEPRHMICPECGAMEYAFEGSMDFLANLAHRLIDRPLRSHKSFAWDAG